MLKVNIKESKNGDVLSILSDSNKNHKLWYKYIKYLIDNPNVINDLGEKLFETVYPRYSLKTITEERAEWYRELMRKS